jgi:hypothetical protein
MNYKGFFGTFLLLLVSLFGLTQTVPPRIFYTEPEKEDTRRTNFEIIGKVGGNFLIYKANRSDDAICVYDNDMKLKQRVKLEATPDQVINVDFIAYPDFFFLFYQYQKKNIVHCMALKMDGNGKQLLDPILLDTTHLGWASNNKIYSTINSDDKQRIMVFKINSKNPKSFYFTTLLYDNALQLQKKDRLTLGMEERNDFLTDFYLTNEGDLVFGKLIRQNSNDYISKVYLVSKYADSASFAIRDVGTGDRILDDVKLKVDNNNKKLLINAFYYKQKRGNIEGLYSVGWNKTTNEKVSEMVTVFDDELRASAKGRDANTRMAFNDFFIKNVLIRKDGGYLLISESQYNTSRGTAFNRWDYFNWGNPWLSPLDYYYYSPYYNSWNSPVNRWGGPNNLTRYHAESIMILSYDKEGKPEWSNVIPKSQFDDESENLISYQMVNTGGEVHFLFNQFERRVLLLNNQSVSSDGKISRNPTLKNLDKGYDFMPRFGKQVSARQLIIPCLYRNYLCFSKLEF